MSYDRTQATPNGIAFHALVEGLKGLTDYGDREAAVGRIQDKLKMETTTASGFLDQLLRAHQTTEAEAKSARSAHACADGDGYELLDQMYDIEESINAERYRDIKNNLDNATALRLEKWVAEKKSRMVYVRLDFEKIDRQKGGSAASRLSAMCQEGNQ